MANTIPQKNYGYGKRPLWQWVVLYVIIGVIVYGLIYYFVFAKKGGYDSSQSGKYQYPTTTQQTTTTQQQNIITLSTNGFAPESITVKAGTTVTWKNSSGADATVNSDPHPTHTMYPPLNLGKFSDGATFTLSFDKPGTYGYHNHFNPSEHGTIIVQ